MNTFETLIRLLSGDAEGLDDDKAAAIDKAPSHRDTGGHIRRFLDLIELEGGLPPNSLLAFSKALLKARERMPDALRSAGLME